MIDTLGFHLYDKWMRNVRAGKNLSRFFEDNLYKKIAIYGMGLIGKQLCDELKGTDINVVFGIDRNAKALRYGDLDIVIPEMITNMDRIDMIVVTPFYSFFEIEEMLIRILGKEDIDIISIEDIVEYVAGL